MRTHPISQITLLLPIIIKQALLHLQQFANLLIMDSPLTKIVWCLLIVWGIVGQLEGGAVKNYNVDPNCPEDIIVHELRITDCDELPCTIRREKYYTVEADIGVTRNVTNPILKCSSVYLGRHIDLPGHGGCDNLVNGSCPMVVGEVYTTSTTWKVPYYVPPMTYTAYCSFVDDEDQNMICGWGSSKVV